MASNYNLFGFLFKNRNNEQQAISFAPPANDDGAVVLADGGAYSTVVDLDGTVKNEIELISKYREMSTRAEVEGAISEIINEAIVVEENKSPVALDTDKLTYSEDIIRKIEDEFANVLNLLDFNNEGQDLFRRWYIDGRLYFHIIIDPSNPTDGIQELRYVDPRRIKLVIETENFINENGVPIQLEKQRYYVYNQFGNDSTTSQIGVKIAPDSICYVHSGIPEANNSMILGHLHKALKPSNLLTMVEDATVIYRLSRAPERRIFYIDVGNLSKQKSEQYVKDLMSRYRNKMVFDATTGEVRDDKKFMPFMEDYWLPRREGGRGTEIDTLAGAENLGEMADVEYFKEKLYQSLNVPVSRLQSQATMSFGEGASITREEVKFGKFIYRLRNRFTQLFDVLLSTQLMLKGVIAKDDWTNIRQKLFYDFLKDTYYSEMKNLEVLRERLGAADACLNYVGKYVSHEWVRRNILQQTSDEMAMLDKQMKIEKADPRYQAIEAMSGGMGMGMPPTGDPNALGGDVGGLDDGMQDQGNPDPSELNDEGDDSLDPETLPTEQITKNIEQLWRR